MEDVEKIIKTLSESRRATLFLSRTHDQALVASTVDDNGHVNTYAITAAIFGELMAKAAHIIIENHQGSFVVGAAAQGTTGGGSGPIIGPHGFPPGLQGPQVQLSESLHDLVKGNIALINVAVGQKLSAR
jgi:hypothetical protein